MIYFCRRVAEQPLPGPLGIGPSLPPGGALKRGALKREGMYGGACPLVRGRGGYLAHLKPLPPILPPIWCRGLSPTP